MAVNTLPNPIPDLLDLADTMIGALHLHEVAIGIKLNTEAAMTASATALRSSVTTYDGAVGAQPALTAAQTAASDAGVAFITLARDLLKPTLGGQWSQAWQPTGFRDNSLALPTKDGPIEQLLKDLQTYYAGHPAQENAPAGVTAAHAGTLATAMKDARSAVDENAKDQTNLLNARDDAETALRKKMRGLIGELDEQLPLGSGLWTTFGLNDPNAAGAPAVPQGLTLTPATPGTLLAAWQQSANTDHYRVFKQVVGTDADFVYATSPSDPNATLQGLPSGATVKVRVTAVNPKGETQPSEVAQAVVG